MKHSPIPSIKMTLFENFGMRKPVHMYIIEGLNLFKDRKFKLYLIHIARNGLNLRLKSIEI